MVAKNNPNQPGHTILFVYLAEKFYEFKTPVSVPHQWYNNACMQINARQLTGGSCAGIVLIKNNFIS